MQFGGTRWPVIAALPSDIAPFGYLPDIVLRTSRSTSCTKVERVVFNALFGSLGRTCWPERVDRPHICVFGRGLNASSCGQDIHLVASSAADRNYLENGYARIFGELPLQFSNDAPALI